MINARVRLKNDTAENWSLAAGFVPLQGELIFYSDLQKIKIGDGITDVSSLPFVGDNYLEERLAEFIDGEEVEF